MKELGVKLSLEDLNEMMSAADINQDGKIDYAGRLIIFVCFQKIKHNPPRGYISLPKFYFLMVMFLSPI